MDEVTESADGYDLPPDAKVCECAGCEVLLLGRSMTAWFLSLTAARRLRVPPLVAGRMRLPGGRYAPFCYSCLSTGSGKEDGPDAVD